ncbi:DUF305 domain-containing protein, partial [Rhizobium ruizarguesonis]
MGGPAAWKTYCPTEEGTLMSLKIITLPAMLAIVAAPVLAEEKPMDMSK